MLNNKLRSGIVVSLSLLLACICQLQGQVAFEYIGTPDSTADRSINCFSDNGAWFAYSMPDSAAFYNGFSGPFIMTQENGKWISPALSRFDMLDEEGDPIFDWAHSKRKAFSRLSYLRQTFQDKDMLITMGLSFLDEHSACIRVSVQNNGDEYLKFRPHWSGSLDLPGTRFSINAAGLEIHSSKSNAAGLISLPDKGNFQIRAQTRSYEIDYGYSIIQPKQSIDFFICHSFSFELPANELLNKNRTIVSQGFNHFLAEREKEKMIAHNVLWNEMPEEWKTANNKHLLMRSLATLQNNWRVAAGELKHEGLFPSYHRIWFNGFWAWDTWKHAAMMAPSHQDLAKNHIRAMFDYQSANGFVADCVFRDTLDEKHNWRNTKPPLAAWAVWKCFEADGDIAFLKELYPKLKAYHEWWYKERDVDKDGLCEYGSTDGTLLAARWESGMDNAVRFDKANMVQSGPNAWSMDQESVDLNAFLFAEKQFLIKICKELGHEFDRLELIVQSEELGKRIRKQFWDPQTSWFYDTDLEGNLIRDAQGSEAWISLWAGLATMSQASQMLSTLTNPRKFYTRMPFPTLSADHEKFDPTEGYWRGPVWIDQAYFAVAGLRSYGFNKEADQATEKILQCLSETKKGTSLHENYHPKTGKGLNAEHFSWTAAHVLGLLTRRLDCQVLEAQ